MSSLVESPSECALLFIFYHQGSWGLAFQEKSQAYTLEPGSVAEFFLVFSLVSQMHPAQHE